MVKWTVCTKKIVSLEYIFSKVYVRNDLFKLSKAQLNFSFADKIRQWTYLETEGIEATQYLESAGLKKQ